MEDKWEIIIPDDLRRIMVVGGWIVKNGYAGSICFVPDPDHKWLTDQYYKCLTN